ncbi:MAG: DEAD/DEAH box helicase [Granulosicoccus sp.]|nr:DEAD/DEAH box helicase [Granulosicoccus sp.]
MSFTSLGLLPELVAAVSDQGYETPTPIQISAIPAILKGRDVMAAAQTGTGKTAGFTLPLLQRLAKGPAARHNQVRALVLTPTRELAAQVAESIQTYGQHTRLRAGVVFGGVNINPQMKRLRSGTDVLVATPGRLLDLASQNAVKFNNLEMLVLDEADRMLDMGFIHDIRRILKLLPKQRQTLMFSATFSKDIRKLASTLVQRPVEISVSPRNTAATAVQQWICPVDKKQKPDVFRQLLLENNWQQVLVFSRTKHGADKLARYLDKHDIKASAIHGNKSQSARTKALTQFKKRSVRVLVATDIAARGLDIDQLPQVVNFDLPNVPEDYVHRIGRTGRAGASGTAISLVCADEFKQLADIEKLIGSILERRFVDGFEPVHELPKVDLHKKDKKPKKPSNARKQGRSHNGSGKHKQRSAAEGATGRRASSRNRRRKPSNTNRVVTS